MSEVIFTLDTPVKYHHAGESVEGTFITLLPPTMKHLDKCIPLKQMFMRAAAQLQGGESTEDAGELEPENVFQVILISQEDALKFLLHGVELLKSGVAMIDGQVKLTAPMIDEMEQEVVEKLIGTFLLNFTLASTLDSQATK